jgi:serine/threonine-protein kinase
MSKMGLSTEDSFSVVVDERLPERPPARLEEGPIVSYVDLPYKQLPERSRLFGRVWTGGEMVTVRYDAIQFPGGSRMPFCAEVDDSGGQVKDSASPPGVAIIHDNVASVRVVARYGEENPSRPKGRLFIYSHPRELPPEVRGPLEQ